MQSHIEPGRPFSDREPGIGSDSVRFFTPDGTMLFAVRQNVDGTLLIRAFDECEVDGKHFINALEVRPVDTRTIVVGRQSKPSAYYWQ